MKRPQTGVRSAGWDRFGVRWYIPGIEVGRDAGVKAGFAGQYMDFSIQSNFRQKLVKILFLR